MNNVDSSIEKKCSDFIFNSIRENMSYQTQENFDLFLELNPKSMIVAMLIKIIPFLSRNLLFR